MAEVAPSTFSNLRQKIEKELGQANVPKAKVKPATSSILGRGDSAKRGKKRAHDGEIVKSATGKKTSTVPAKDAIQADDQDEQFKQVVAELGGGQEDFELMQDAASDSEVEGDVLKQAGSGQSEPRRGKTLESGMANILKEIALARDTYEDADTDEDLPVREKKKADRQNGSSISVAKIEITEAPVTTGKKHKTRFSCEPRPDWFNQGNKFAVQDAKLEFSLPMRSVEQLQKYARDVLRRDNEAFQAFQSSSSSQSFYNTVIASGTLSDKISALTLAVQESPLHNMKALEGLLGLARKRSRTQAVDVLRALKDLFAQGSLLPGDRRLFTFSTNPALRITFGRLKAWNFGDSLPSGVTDQDLAVWAYEDWLKEQYFEILRILESWSNDELEFSKSRATSYVYELLKEKPEQEANLLRLLINKLGDPVKKIASQASYLLMQLLGTHPAMKEIVVSAIDTDFIFKPSQSIHAKYYAAVTLNQTALSAKEENIAIRLLDIYFGLFRTILKPEKEKETDISVQSQTRHQRQKKRPAKDSGTDQEDEFKEKLISAVLTGVNRAYPYCGTEHRSFTDHIDTLFQITHSANFNTSIQAMMLMQQLISTNSAPSDRFYRTLYESLLDSRLITSSKQQLYLNLLHRSLKADLNTKRVKAFVKRILQMLTLQEPPFVCGAFFLLKDLEKSIPSLTSLIDQSEDHDDEEEAFKDVDEDAQPNLAPISRETESNAYDPYKRAPEFARADRSCAWDILPFLAHYHPAVNVSADHLIDHKNMLGKPDLSLHTLIHFLDRFVYKNPKLTATRMRGASIMQPMASDDTRAVLLSTSAKANRIAVNSEEFRVKKSGDIAAEDVFFHQYFNNLGKSPSTKAKKTHVDPDDVDSMGSGDEDEVWKAMVDTAPELEGIEDDNSDEISDMSDFDAELDDEEMSDVLANGDGSDDGVDVEAGIFDDSEIELNDDDELDDGEPDFEGLKSDDQGSKSAPVSANSQRNRESREQKKKFKALPTFASAADYAKMLEDDADEDLG